MEKSPDTSSGDKTDSRLAAAEFMLPEACLPWRHDRTQKQRFQSNAYFAVSFLTDVFSVDFFEDLEAKAFFASLASLAFSFSSGVL